MDLQTLTKIETIEQYEEVRRRIDFLIKEGTDKNMLELDLDNEYIREIGRLSRLGARYETDYMKFEHLEVRKKSPLIRSIEDQMYAQNINQKELANMLGMNEPSLSQIIRGKRPISMKTAKRLHNTLKIDPKLLIDYA